jgi:hypothetical protein
MMSRSVRGSPTAAFSFALVACWTFDINAAKPTRQETGRDSQPIVFSGCALFLTLPHCVNGNYTDVHPRYPSPLAYRRPVPTGAEDIGTWLDILQITSVVSVITNAALVCYTMQLTSDYSDVGQLWIFIGFQYTIFVIMAIFAYVVDDCPEEVSGH